MGQILDQKEFAGMGVLQVTKHVRTSYFSPSGKARLKSVVTYSVYFVPVNSDLDINEYYSGPRKADALKAFRAESKSYSRLHAEVESYSAKMRDLRKSMRSETESQPENDSERDNVIFVDFVAKKRIA